MLKQVAPCIGSRNEFPLHVTAQPNRLAVIPSHPAAPAKAPRGAGYTTIRTGRKEATMIFAVLAIIGIIALIIWIF